MWIVVAASIVLITAALTATAKPGASFYGSSAHGTYGLFVQTRCTAGCQGGPTSALVQLTAGKTYVASKVCPFGTIALPNPPIVNGTFTTGGWYFVAKKDFVWFWVFGRLVPGGGIVGEVKSSPVCGRPDNFTLQPGSA